MNPISEKVLEPEEFWARFEEFRKRNNLGTAPNEKCDEDLLDLLKEDSPSKTSKKKYILHL